MRYLILLIVILVQCQFVVAQEVIKIGVLMPGGVNKQDRVKGLHTLIMETVKRTNIDLDATQDMVKIDKGIYNYPFLIMVGDGGFVLNAVEKRYLRDYLQLGGTLFLDNSGGVKGNSFDISVRRVFREVFPDSQFEPVTSESVIFRTFYLLKATSGRVIAQPFLEGLKIGGRYGVIYSMNDLLGALVKDEQGRWVFDVHPGDERQREFAIRLGINILMYSLTLDYKDDQVHKPFIIRREQY